MSGFLPASLYVPDLFFIECANILWNYVRSFGYPAENARLDVRDLGALALRVVSTADLLAPALELALAFNISAHDACYVALAQQTGLPLVTADERLRRKLAGSQVAVQMLRGIPAD